MSHALMTNLNSWLTAKLTCASSAIAAGAGDAATVTGATINRLQPGVAAAANNGSHLAQCMKIVLAAKATLAQAATAIFKMTLQHGTLADGSDMANVAAALQPDGAAASTNLTLTGAAGGSTEQSQKEYNVNLESLNQFVRVNTFIDLSAANTDIGLYTVTLDLGGFRNVPVS